MNSQATNPKPTGLAGVVAGTTAIATVGKEGSGLTYRGYKIEDLAENARFEEVAWLLLHDDLPTQAELTEFEARLASQSGLPSALITAMGLPEPTNSFSSTLTAVITPLKGAVRRE